METIFLNIIPTGVNQICHVSQNDNERIIRVKLLEGNLSYSFKEGDEVTFSTKKPDNTAISVPVVITVGTSYADISITNDMCDIVGQNLCELCIVNAGTRIGTSNFYMEVEIDPSYVPDPPVPPEPPKRRGGLDVIIYEQMSTTYETL